MTRDAGGFGSWYETTIVHLGMFLFEYDVPNTSYFMHGSRHDEGFAMSVVCSAANAVHRSKQAAGRHGGLLRWVLQISICACCVSQSVIVRHCPAAVIRTIICCGPDNRKYVRHVYLPDPFK